MLVVQIADQLGNQMFAYASVKSIALKKGMQFRFIRKYNNQINDNDQKYGNEIHTIFPHLAGEFLTELPKQVTSVYQEPPLKKRTSNYQESALQVADNTLMLGHYISYKYLEDHLQQLYTWFSFPHETESQVTSELEKLKEKYPGRPLVAVHFRIGADYMHQGFRLQNSYWFRAAEKILRESTNKPVFLLFYDRPFFKRDIVDLFLNKYDCEICRSSLIHDMCMMSKCQMQIICNSSFSIMSAILNQNPDRKIFRPSVHPVGLQFYPTDCYADNWIIIPAKRSILSFLNCIIMHIKGKLLQVLRPG